MLYKKLSTLSTEFSTRISLDKRAYFLLFQQDIDKIYQIGQKENRIVFGDIKRKNGELCMKTDLLFHKSVEKRALAGKALADRKKAV